MTSMIEEPAVRDFTIQRGTDFSYKFFARDKYTLEYVDLNSAIIEVEVNNRDNCDGETFITPTATWAFEDIYDYTGELIYEQAPLITIVMTDTQTKVENDIGFWNIKITIGTKTDSYIKGKMTFEGCGE
jgi:hypothetical protein